MRSRAGRTVGLIIGGLAILIGCVWIGQGAGLIKGELHDGQLYVARYRSALSGCRTVLDLPVSATSLGPKREPRSLAASVTSAGSAFTAVAGAGRRRVIRHLLYRPAVAIRVSEEHE